MLDNFKKKVHRRIKTYFDARLGPELAERVAALEAELEHARKTMDGLMEQQKKIDESLGVERLRERARLYRLFQRVSGKAGASPVPPPTPGKTLDDSLVELEKLVPAAFFHWKALFEINRKAYTGFPTHSCSVRGHAMAELFQFFLAPYLAGRVLDMGCGPQPVPWYLEGFSHSHMAGIDPLPPSEGDHPFVFHQGVSEFLPWQDGVFDTVVAATSLDHVLLLDRVLEEIRRVMTPDGVLIVWVAFMEGALPYNPYHEGIQPVDDYHLFHFDRPWFEEVIRETFRIEEEIHLKSPGVSSFYALTPRAGTRENGIDLQGKSS